MVGTALHILGELLSSGGETLAVRTVHNADDLDWLVGWLVRFDQRAIRATLDDAAYSEYLLVAMKVLPIGTLLLLVDKVQ